jgi:hypothetical protein
MKLDKKDDLVFGAEPVSYAINVDKSKGADSRDEGALIFCCISLVLAVIALWATGAAYVDLSSVMF